MNPRPNERRPRRGFALIPVLFLITLLAAAAVQLVTVTGREALRQARRADTLRHELAVDSALRVAAQVLREAEGPALRAMDRDGVYPLEFDLGDVHIACRVTNDGAKLDVGAFADDQRGLKRALQTLARGAGMDDDAIAPTPIDIGQGNAARPYVWFDQLLDNPGPGTIFRWGEDTSLVWSDVVTCFGSGRVDVRRAPRMVLEAALNDIDRTMAGKLVAVRRKSPGADPRSALASYDGDLRRRTETRLDYDMHRYALTMDTAIGADKRRWYVVATITEDAIDVHHRGPITW